MSLSEEGLRKLLSRNGVETAIKDTLYAWISSLGFLVTKSATRAKLLPWALRIWDAASEADCAEIHRQLRVESSTLYKNKEDDATLGRASWALIGRFRAAAPLPAARAPSPVRPAPELKPLERQAHDMISRQVSANQPEQAIVASCVSNATMKREILANIMKAKGLGAMDGHKANKADLCRAIVAKTKVDQSDLPPAEKEFQGEILVQALASGNEEGFMKLCTNTYLTDGIQHTFEKAGGVGAVDRTKNVACRTLRDQIQARLSRSPRRPSGFWDAPVAGGRRAVMEEEEPPVAQAPAPSGFWDAPVVQGRRAVVEEEEPPVAQAPAPSGFWDAPAVASSKSVPAGPRAVVGEEPVFSFPSVAPARPRVVVEEEPVELQEVPSKSCGNLVEEESRCDRTEICEIQGDIADPETNLCLSKTRTFEFKGKMYTGPREQMNQLEKVLRIRSRVVVEDEPAYATSPPRAPSPPPFVRAPSPPPFARAPSPISQRRVIDVLDSSDEEYEEDEDEEKEEQEEEQEIKRIDLRAPPLRIVVEEEIPESTREDAKEKARELVRAREAASREREAARQAELEREREAARQAELEAMAREAAKQADLEREREAARQAELEAMAREAEEKEREAEERARELEMEAAREREAAARETERRTREAELRAARELEALAREAEAEATREREAAERARAKAAELERQREAADRARAEERERVREQEEAKQAELERETKRRPSVSEKILRVRERDDRPLPPLAVRPVVFQSRNVDRNVAAALS